MEDHKKVLSIQILIEVEVEVLKPHFKAGTKACMVDIINMKVSLMEVDEEILEEEEVVEVVVEVIKVNYQITTQIATMGNLGTWQKIVIKRSMMHEMESYNKGIMHQLCTLNHQHLGHYRSIMSSCLDGGKRKGGRPFDWCHQNTYVITYKDNLVDHIHVE